jgi:hypothetical protein
MRKPLAAVVIAGAVISLAVAVHARAAGPKRMRVYTAILTSAQVVPPKTNIRHAVAFLTVDERTQTLVYSIPGTDGGTRTAVRFRGPAGPGEEADALFDVPVATFATPMQGTVQLTSAQVKHFRKGLVYVEIETTTDPDGEVRGQVVPVGPAYRAPRGN